ncbi:MAG: alginate export family protein [Nitrospirota bacterium]|nr:alginate export family protein [Nitrospirota bacterium]
MQSIQRRMGWAGMATFFSAAVMAAGLSFGTAPAQAAFELPEGEKITNVPAIPRAIPQKEAYELYDPKIGKNFDLKNFWIRADLRVRPEMRNGVCFGGGSPSGGACNALNGKANLGKSANDFYVQQMTRLGIGYDLSPDVNFYMEIIDSAVWGANTGVGGDALNHNGAFGSTATGNQGRLGVRAAYMLVRNFAGIQGLSVKAGRQYIVFGNHSLFGHFDWANTGFSHDGVMLQYSTKAFDSYLGWFRTQEGDLAQGAPVGSVGGNVTGGAVGQTGATSDADMLIFYNQIKSVPGFLIEPYYFMYKNATPNGTNQAQGLGTNKHSNQTRHSVGNRIEMRKGNFDAINEITYQFGQMGDSGGQNATAASLGNQKNLSISAWATRNWIGYTHYQSSWKPRLAFNFDYASGDGRANCTIAGSTATGCKTANTFENMFPTNHIHMGYMDVQAWKNMMSPSVNFQARPTKDDHIEVWATSLNLANSQDNWYRGSQGVYVFSKNGNTKKHIGDELDVAWTHMFMDGKLAFQAAYGHLFAGSYIRENLGTSSNQDWAYVQLWMNF